MSTVANRYITPFHVSRHLISYYYHHIHHTSFARDTARSLELLIDDLGAQFHHEATVEALWWPPLLPFVSLVTCANTICSATLFSSYRNIAHPLASFRVSGGFGRSLNQARR